MKYIQSLLLVGIFLCMGISSAFAEASYESYLDYNEVSKYRELIDTKLGAKLDTVSEKTKESLKEKIDKVIPLYAKKDISDKKKTYYVNLLTALYQKITEAGEDVYYVEIISDSRCRYCESGIEYTVDYLEGILVEKEVLYRVYDYQDNGVAEYLDSIGQQGLPLYFFEEKTGIESIDEFMQETSDDRLVMLANEPFNPDQAVSSRGYQVLEKEIYEDILKNSHRNGTADAKIALVEFSDLECPFCAKLHSEGTFKKIEDNYGGDVAFYYHNFPLSFHKNAYVAAQILECVGDEKGSEAYFDYMEDVFALSSFSLETLEEMVKQGQELTQEEIDACVEDTNIKGRIDSQMQRGIDVFEINGTPTTVIINTQTLEYEIIGGAYPYSSFESKIDALK